MIDLLCNPDTVVALIACLLIPLLALAVSVYNWVETRRLKRAAAAVQRAKDGLPTHHRCSCDLCAQHRKRWSA